MSDTESATGSDEDSFSGTSSESESSSGSGSDAESSSSSSSSSESDAESSSDSSSESAVSDSASDSAISDYEDDLGEAPGKARRKLGRGRKPAEDELDAISTVASILDSELESDSDVGSLADFEVASHASATDTATSSRRSAGPPPTIFLYGDDRRTRPMLTKFEVAGIIGQRALAIQGGAQIYVDLPAPVGDARPPELSPQEIAEREYRERRTPLLVLRRVPRWPDRPASEPADAIYKEVWDPKLLPQSLT